MCNLFNSEFYDRKVYNAYNIKYVEYKRSAMVC